MQLRLLASPDNAQLRRRYVLAIAVSVMAGIAMSIWLAVDSPVEAPARTSYLPGN
jgi:hypothetical protein